MLIKQSITTLNTTLTKLHQQVSFNGVLKINDDLAIAESSQ
jgi:hypothetical protein